MDDLKSMAVFAVTIDTGSMSAAARCLGMSASAVSQTIRSLELKNSVTLMHRSTRKLALTEAGERYYPHCKRLLEAAHAASESLQQTRDTLIGELRLSAPVGFANHLALALAPLLAEAPELRLRLLVDDAMIDLIDARIDLAIRVGRLADSSWVARHLCDYEIILCASPSYLSQYGAPETPLELLKHQWLALGQKGQMSEALNDDSMRVDNVEISGLERTLAKNSQAVSLSLDLQHSEGALQAISVKARIVSNNQVVLQHMCTHGLGIACLVRAEVLPLIQSGNLIQVLPAWNFAPMPVWGVTPKRDREAAKVRIALDYLKRYFATLP